MDIVECLTEMLDAVALARADYRANPRRVGSSGFVPVQDGSDSDDAAVAVEFKSRRVTGALPRIQLDKNHNVLPPA